MQQFRNEKITILLSIWTKGNIRADIAHLDLQPSDEDFVNSRHACETNKLIGE